LFQCGWVVEDIKRGLTLEQTETTYERIVIALYHCLSPAIEWDSFHTIRLVAEKRQLASLECRFPSRRVGNPCHGKRLFYCFVSVVKEVKGHADMDSVANCHLAFPHLREVYEGGVLRQHGGVEEPLQGLEKRCFAIAIATDNEREPVCAELERVVSIVAAEVPDMQFLENHSLRFRYSFISLYIAFAVAPSSARCMMLATALTMWLSLSNAAKIDGMLAMLYCP
jgi:hypothetical protein